MSDANPEGMTSYDMVPYPSGPFWRTHPANLAMVAHLFNLQSPSVRTARVLELGCASGGNLIPMAQQLPNAEFLGVDLSRVQVAEAQETISKLGLKNVRIEHRSIMDVSLADGKFDYIIVHGIYSWVPPEVQHKILQIGHEQLQPTGVFYVSYNALPGWHLRGAVRNMMKYHAAMFKEPAEKVRQVRLLLDFLVKGSAGRADAYNKMLEDEAKVLSNQSDAYLYHDHLEVYNEPLYFHEFMERAKAVELQYLGEADFCSMLSTRFPPDTAEALKSAPLMRQEQYMDFLRSRTFRSTLLCHKDLPLQRAISAEKLASTFIALEAPLTSEGTTWDQEVNTFKVGERSLGIRLPVTKAAVIKLSELWPRKIDFDTLLNLCLQTLQEHNIAEDSPEKIRARLMADLMDLMAGSLLRVSMDAPELPATISRCPVGSPLARLQAQTRNVVVNLWHESVKLDALAHSLLKRLDGTHTWPELAQFLKEDQRAGVLKVRREEKEVAELPDQAWMAAVETGLKSLQRCALLTA